MELVKNYKIWGILIQSQKWCLCSVEDVTTGIFQNSKPLRMKKGLILDVTS